MGKIGRGAAETEHGALACVGGGGGGDNEEDAAGAEEGELRISDGDGAEAECRSQNRKMRRKKE